MVALQTVLCRLPGVAAIKGKQKKPNNLKVSTHEIWQLAVTAGSQQNIPQHTGPYLCLAPLPHNLPPLSLFLSATVQRQQNVTSVARLLQIPHRDDSVSVVMGVRKQASGDMGCSVVVPTQPRTGSKFRWQLLLSHLRKKRTQKKLLLCMSYS